ncbi:MAG: hypothetical protein QM804_19105 [Propionicimonas sp.]
MFAGLSQNWPAGSAIPPYIREPEDRCEDFELVNKGYLGYMDLGYTRRDVEMFVWLEALRDKQCARRHPASRMCCWPGTTNPQGGLPVRIHIPQMFELLGNGKFTEALQLLEEVNPLPNVTGRVCRRSCSARGCASTSRR